MNNETRFGTLRRIRIAVRKINLEKQRTNAWFLLHDNAPAHRSVLVKDFLAKNNVTTLEHPPHSPDLVPAEFYLFLRLRPSLNGQCFCDVTGIIKNATEELKRLSKNASRNVSYNFTVAGRCVYLQKGNILKEMYLK